MDYRKTAEAILAGIGGESNITHLEHCSTRLRFTLADNRLVQVDALKKIPGVLGVVMTAQCQVIIGNQVVEVYNALSPMVHTANSPAPMPGNGQKRRAGDVLLDFIVGVFQPLVPAIAGGGILKSVLLLLSMIGLIAKDSTAYTIFNTLADAPFYFLPLLVADAAAVKLQCSRFLALSTVGSLLLPNMITLIGGETRLFGLPLTNVNYAYQVFPALLCVLFLALVEKYVTKWSPKVIRIFFVPLLCFAVVVPVTLLALGPAGYWFGVAFTKGILFLFNKLGWIAVTVLAVALPFMIAIGMHKALLPYAVTSISELGKELLYLPASLAHNIAESGACFAAAIRAKGSEERSTAVSAGISALFGITEPALYGVTLQNKRILWSVMIGAGLGGAYVGLFSVEAFVAVDVSLGDSDHEPRPCRVRCRNRVRCGICVRLPALSADGGTSRSRTDGCGSGACTDDCCRQRTGHSVLSDERNCHTSRGGAGRSILRRRIGGWDRSCAGQRRTLRPCGWCDREYSRKPPRDLHGDRWGTGDSHARRTGHRFSPWRAVSFAGTRGRPRSSYL